MRIEYTKKKFKPATLAIIRQANAICAQYAAQGLQLTLRQLYYQFVARGLIANEQTEYARLGGILNDARMAGYMDWDYLVDRTRNLVALPFWANPSDIMDSVVRSYRTDRWANQPFRVEVWIEKDAGIGVIEAVCQRNQVPYFSCRGYTSVSELWAASQRIRGYLAGGQHVRILHIGDHDPSGIDMSRDIEDRLTVFLDGDRKRLVVDAAREALEEKFGDNWDDHYRVLDSDGKQQWVQAGTERAGVLRWGDLTVERIALNYDQVVQYDPPPNPAKASDARFRSYTEATGLFESWELDALDPIVLQNLIQDGIDNVRDAGSWDFDTERMENDRRVLTQVRDRWDDLVDLLEREE